MITVLVALDLPEPHEVPGTPLEGYLPELGDVAESLAARLSEFYPDSTGGFAVPSRLCVAATTKGVATHLMQAAIIGLDSGDESMDVAAYDVVNRLSSNMSTVGVTDPSRT